MPKRPTTPESSRTAEPTTVSPQPPDATRAKTISGATRKNPAAVALGRLGGKKGGPARAAKLSKKRLSEIGKKAAARWAKKAG